MRAKRVYARIYAIVREIPHARVATYGQVAAIEGNCTARMVGYALAALNGAARDVPWQRVINSAGRISERSGGGGTSPQHRLLAAEGLCFDARGCVDFDAVGWPGPDWDWLRENDCQPTPRPAGKRRRTSVPSRK